MRIVLRKSVYILYVSLIFGAFQNCAPMHSLNSESSSSSFANFSAEEMSQKFSTTLQPLLRANCSACHGISQVPMFAVVDSLTATNTIMEYRLANLDNPAGSRFVSQIMSGHQGFTPSLALDVQGAIQAWADALSGNTAPPDTQMPLVAITAPANGASFMGSINVSAGASDNVGVTGVQFLLDGAPVGVELTSAPYATVLSGLAAGTHTVSAQARDAAGNIATAASVSFTVTVAPADTILPTASITAPANGATVSATVNVTADASDNVGVVGVRLYVDGNAYGTEDTAAPYSIPLITTGLMNGSHSLVVRARDAAGNMADSAARMVTVSNAVSDTTAPLVSITAPAAGAVAGTVSITANASDNVGVAGVTFLVNGAVTGTEDTSAPYSVSWNTAGLASGNYSLTARARDAAGNMTTSAAVVVSVTASNPNATYTWIAQNILVPKCVACHGANGASAGVRLNTYANTLQIVRPGNVNGSELYSITESGEMPQGGADLSNTELTAIADWIRAGAPNN